MNKEQLWLTFLETGYPEVYLLYNQARMMEEPNVSDSSWSGTSGNSLQ